MKEFWEKQAREYGFDIKAVNFDPLEEDLELHFTKGLFKEGEMVCDLGCGNGRTLLNLAKINKGSKFYGVDFIQDFIDIANIKKGKMRLSNVKFFLANAESEDIKHLFRFKFDKVITKRLLINLKGKEKLSAIRNIHSLLKSGGTYIMIECFSRPLAKVNRIRKNLGLGEIRVKTFNEYLTDSFLAEIQKFFTLKEKIDFESLYYFTSRVYNAYLSKGEPDYFSGINKLAVALSKMGLSSAIEGYSPQVMCLLKKKSYSGGMRVIK